MSVATTYSLFLRANGRGLAPCLLVAAIFLSLLSSVCAAQVRGSSDEVTVTTQIGEQRIYLGDKQFLRFIVTGSRDIVPPKLPSSPACEVEYAGAFDQSSSTTIIINGRLSQQSTVQLALQYQLSPTQVGIVKIPSVTILIDSKAYQTQPVEFEVIDVPASRDSTLKLLCDRTQVYVGEPVPVTLVWRIAGDVQSPRFDVPSIAAAEFVPGPDPAPPGAYNADPRFVRLKFSTFEHNARLQEVTSDGKRFREVRMDLVLMPSRAGELLVPPVRVVFDAVVGRRAPRPMEFAFGEVAVTERQIALSEPLRLAVLDLPTVGRPADFSGLIGSFSLSADVTQKEASVGEPIDLRVTVTGTHPLSRVPPLDLARQTISRDFRVPRDPILAAQARSSVVFDAAIRARRPGSIIVPPIELNYFDTAAGAYKVASSAPLSLNVADAPTVGLPNDADDDGTSGTAAVTASEDSPSLASPRTLAELPVLLAWNPLVDSPTRFFTTLGAMLAAPLLIGLTVSWVAHLRCRSSPSAVRRRAYRLFRRRVAAAANCGTGILTDELSAAARGYVSDSLSDGKKLTSDEAASVVRGHVATASADALAHTLTRLDAARFAPAGRLSDGSEASVVVRNVIRDLHRALNKEQA